MTDAESLLSLPLGTPGAGRIRFGAAMALYQQGRLSPAELEAWRVAAASDTRPVDHVFAAHGLPQRPLSAPDPATALSRLIQEATAYLAPLRCPGAAEFRCLLAGLPTKAAPTTPLIPPIVSDHLAPALNALQATHPALAAAIAATSPHLEWATYDSYPPEEIGPAFMANHAFCSIAGASAPYRMEGAEFGLFLIAPNILYRDHSHPAPELYLPLTGPHGWRFGPHRPLIMKAAHQPVWNDPHRPHLTKVGPTPFLAFYGWLRDIDAPARILPASDWTVLEALRLKDGP